MLARRDRTSWSTPDFQALIRPAGRFAARDMLIFHEACGLVRNDDDVWILTERGTDVVEQLRGGTWSGLGSAVLASGAYDDELSRLLEGGTVVDGHLRCPLARLPRIAPTAGAILAWEPTHRDGNELVVAISTFDDLLALSAMEQAAQVPQWVEDQQSVGWRAELYSWRREVTTHGAQHVLHTSRDVGDGFGYDIERTGPEASAFIEVKGSRGRQLTFVVTKKELEVARANPDTYEIQFWGQVELGRVAGREYAHLASLGYPIVITDVAARIDAGELQTEPQSWRIRGEDALG